MIIDIIKYNSHKLFQYLLYENSLFFMGFFVVVVVFLHKLQMLQFWCNFHHFLALIKHAKSLFFNEEIAYRLIMLNITIFDIIAEITSF